MRAELGRDFGEYIFDTQLLVSTLFMLSSLLNLLINRFKLTRNLTLVEPPTGAIHKGAIELKNRKMESKLYVGAFNGPFVSKSRF